MRHVQRKQRRQAIPRAAECNALPHSQQSEQPDRRNADIRVAGQKRDAHGRAAQQEQRDGQLCAAPEPSVDAREDDRAHRARDERERKQSEGIERSGQRIDKRKDELRKNDDRGDCVDEEVEELGGAAHDDANRDLGRVQLAVMVVKAPRIPLER
jgi:hypothetical protein